MIVTSGLHVDWCGGRVEQVQVSSGGGGGGGDGPESSQCSGALLGHSGGPGSGVTGHPT